ncbi:MAG: hypothetical protein ACI9OJ_005780, partial [Myxococcota bacterium]
DGKVIVRNRQTGEIGRKTRAGSSSVSLTFNNDSNVLSIQDANRVTWFNVENGFKVPLPEALEGARIITSAANDKRTAFMRGGTVYLVNGRAGTAKPLAGFKNVDTLVMSPDGTRLIVAAAGKLTVIDATRGRPIGELETDGVAFDGLAWDPKSRIICGVGEDAAVRFWARGETKPRAALLVDRHGEWIAWQGSGAFDASAEGGRYVAWKVGSRVYPVGRFRERFQIPGLLRHQLAKTVGKLGLNGMDSFSPPPGIRIVSPEPTSATKDDVIQVTVEATDAGGGISEIRLYHQGRLVEQVTRGLSSAKNLRRSFDVLLEPGDNRIEATALSTGRIESRTPTTQVTFGEKNERVRMRLLSIGINDYRDSTLVLKHARADAEAVAKSLEAGGKRLFKGGFEAKVLTDNDATKRGVLAGFEWLIQSTRADDVAVVYLAGHGDTVGDEYYFLPQELRYTNLDAVKTGGISQSALRELIRRIPARKVVVLLDTCKSGAVSLGFASRSLGEKKALSLLGQAAGIYLIAASTSRQLALEDSNLGHGLFTWSLLRGLEGHADHDGDRTVTIRELVTFLETEVSRVSKETFDQEQFPVTHGNGRNFPIAIPTK